jgi:hypothetical protein
MCSVTACCCGRCQVPLPTDWPKGMPWHLACSMLHLHIHTSPACLPPAPHLPAPCPSQPLQQQRLP